MSVRRREFLKKSCATGVCLCGLVPNLFAEGENKPPAAEAEKTDTKNNLMYEWLSNLMSAIDKKVDKKVIKEILKECSPAHYKDLNMDNVIAPYKGNINAFLKFISEKWGLKVDYDKKAGTIRIDEGKSYCGCPLVDNKNKMKSSILCYCSEGFNELIFSAVIGRPVRVEVIESILKGNKSCKYKVTILSKA